MKISVQHSIIATSCKSNTPTIICLNTRINYCQKPITRVKIQPCDAGTSHKVLVALRALSHCLLQDGNDPLEKSETNDAKKEARGC